MAAGVISGILAMILLLISVLQFRQKGFLLNNASVLASQKEREEMDANPKMKRAHYRQSGYVFLLAGIAFAFLALYCFLKLHWLVVLFWLLAAAALVYAAASSIKTELHK